MGCNFKTRAEKNPVGSVEEVVPKIDKDYDKYTGN